MTDIRARRYCSRWTVPNGLEGTPNRGKSLETKHNRVAMSRTQKFEFLMFFFFSEQQRLAVTVSEALSSLR